MPRRRLAHLCAVPLQLQVQIIGSLHCRPPAPDRAATFLWTFMSWVLNAGRDSSWTGLMRILETLPLCPQVGLVDGWSRSWSAALPLDRRRQHPGRVGTVHTAPWQAWPMIHRFNMLGRHLAPIDTTLVYPTCGCGDVYCVTADFKAAATVPQWHRWGHACADAYG